MEVHAVIREDIGSASSALEHLILDGSVKPRHIPLALLQRITDNFADKRQVGRGGFGVVYKVTLSCTIFLTAELKCCSKSP
jgi:hypothetical protein